jgi:hypothetical protein
MIHAESVFTVSSPWNLNIRGSRGFRSQEYGPLGKGLFKSHPKTGSVKSTSRRQLSTQGAFAGTLPARPSPSRR